MSHTCHARECKTDVPPKMFMCKPHWAMVPKIMQKEVWRLYRPGQETDKRPTMEYITYVQTVILYVWEKEQKMKLADTHSGLQGGSIREKLESQLLDAVRKYVEMKDIPLAELDLMGPSTAITEYMQAEKLLATQRGKVRGLAMAVTTWRNMYNADRVREAQAIEREFMKRVKDAR